MPAQSGASKSNEELLELLACDLVLRLFMQLLDIDLVSEVPPEPADPPEHQTHRRHDPSSHQQHL